MANILILMQESYENAMTGKIARASENTVASIY